MSPFSCPRRLIICVLAGRVASVMAGLLAYLYLSLSRYRRWAGSSWLWNVQGRSLPFLPRSHPASGSKREAAERRRAKQQAPRAATTLAGWRGWLAPPSRRSDRASEIGVPRQNSSCRQLRRAAIFLAEQDRHFVACLLCLTCVGTRQIRAKPLGRGLPRDEAIRSYLL